MSNPLERELVKALVHHARERIAATPEGDYAGQGGEIRAIIEIADEWDALYAERLKRMWKDVAEALLEEA